MSGWRERENSNITHGFLCPCDQEMTGANEQEKRRGRSWLQKKMVDSQYSCEDLEFGIGIKKVYLDLKGF